MSKAAAAFVWVDEEMVWRRREGDVWVDAQPSLPEWAAVRGGRVPPAQFVRLWSRAETLNQLKSWLFWMSLEEIEQRRASMSAWLESEGFLPLAVLPTRAESLLTQTELAELVKDGCLVRAEGAEDDYDYDGDEDDESYDEDDESYDDDDESYDEDDESYDEDDESYDDDDESYDEADADVGAEAAVEAAVEAADSTGAEGGEEDLTPLPPRPDEDPWRYRDTSGRQHVETTEGGSWRRFRVKH